MDYRVRGDGDDDDYDDDDNGDDMIHWGSEERVRVIILMRENG